MTTTLENIRLALQREPESSVSEVAKAVGVSRQYVHQLCRKHNITTGTGLARAAKNRQWTNHFGGAEKLSSHFVGGASELCASADLLRRGIPVYRALTFVSAADLVIDYKGRLVRVEVRSAKRNDNGSLRYPQPVDRSRYDLLALVEPDGNVTYKPPLENLLQATSSKKIYPTKP